MSDSIIEKWKQVSDWDNLRVMSVDERIALHGEIFADWDVETHGPAPIWFPTDDDVAGSNLADLMKRTGHADLESLCAWWQSSPERFWKAVTFLNLGPAFFGELPRGVLEYDDPRDPTWFSGAKYNIVESCLLASGAIENSKIAIKYAGANSEIKQLDHRELRERVEVFAARIRAAGFEPCDRLAIVMPMNMDSVVIYLGILYAGCTVVSIADSFAAGEIAKRLRISGAKGVFFCTRYQRAGKTISLGKNVHAAQQICKEAGQQVQLFSEDYTWPEVTPLKSPYLGGPDHVINILFSSGTTGDPKAIPWDQTTPLKCMADGSLHQDIGPEDVIVWPTNLGWMMGPWLIFASLMNGAAIGLFEDAPTGNAFGEFVQDAKTTMLGVVPALVRHWKQTKCMEAFDWSSIRCFSSTGEASNATDMTYLSALAGFRPVIEYCGGTEIGGGYASSTMIQPNLPATFSTAAVGHQLIILDDDGHPADEGELYLVPPAIGLSRTLLNRDHFETYYANVPDHELPLRRHGDRLQRLPGGYFRACGRADDTMNPGGIKVGSAEIETIINGIEGIAESAVIAVSENGTGPDQLVAFLVPSKQIDQDSIITQINAAIRAQLNPLIRVSKIRIAESLPRTASNKIIRRELRKSELESN